MRFEWDRDKYDENLRKHGVRFEVATTVFDDPNEFTEEDWDAIAERRWRTVGKSELGHHLFVIHRARYYRRRSRCAHHFGTPSHSSREEKI